MEQAINKGITDLLNLAPIITVLVLVILGLVFFARSLLKDAKEERTLYRETLTNNTAVMAEFKELIRNALSK